jgi:HD-GYP domain-containing protein (c-di-GMP phosphodiesterase class II)
MRTALVGMRLADELQLPAADRSALFYALLLKDLGCSSNAAKMAYLFGADDQTVKRSIRMIDWTKAGQCMKNCWQQCAPHGSTVEKLMTMAAIVRQGAEAGRKISEIRCERGADIARMLELPEATAQAIYELDEHWNGGGSPRGLKGEEISLLGRICCLSQTVEVYFRAYGVQSAVEMANDRRRKWFDPQLVDALVSLQHETSFWNSLREVELLAELERWEPGDAIVLADDACLDRVAEAFAKVVDAKSPWTYQHSTRVAEIAMGVARQLGCPAALERDLRRAALLHDTTADEFACIQKHPDYTQQVLEQVSAFKALADVAAAHHERLDGRGYHRRLEGGRIPWAARVLTVADICEAMSARRPYRDAMPWPKIYQTMSQDAGRGVDADCLRALAEWQDRHELESRVENQLREVDRLLSEI